MNTAPNEGSLADQLGLDRVTRFQVLILTLGVFVLFCDGFDAQMMSFVAPALARDLALRSTDLGPVFAMNLAGLTVGAALLAPFADGVSRKFMIILCVTLFGLSTLLVPLLVPFFPPVPALLILRFVTGMCMGAAMPMMIAMASEFVPWRLKARLLVVLSCAFSAGATLCSAVSGPIIQTFGWKTLFWIGGLLPFAAAFMIFVFLPESPRYLALRNKTDQLIRLAAKLAPGTAFNANAQERPATAKRRLFPVKELFTEGRAFLTLLIWATFFCYGASLYFLVNWLPTLVTKAGFSISQATAATTMYHVGGLVGGFLISFLVDRSGLRALVTSTFAACFAIALMSFTTGSLATIFVAAFIVGVLVIGNQHTVNVLTGSTFYPNAVRATGLGWALASVRLGGVLAGSLGAGLLLNSGLPIASIFVIIALGELCAGISLATLYLMQRGSAVSASSCGSGTRAMPELIRKRSLESH